MAQKDSYTGKIQGTVGGKSFSKTISEVNYEFLKNQSEATEIASKVVKLFDTGSTVDSVHLIYDKKFTTEAVAG